MLARRRRLWDIHPAYHCPLLGTCIPMAALRRMARRAGIEQWRSASDYELHHYAVHRCAERNELSKLLQKDLDARFASQILRFAALEREDALVSLWKEALERGDVAGALWALISHPLASPPVCDLASQDVHMLSHRAGAAVRADLARLTALEGAREALHEELDSQAARSAAQLAERDARIAALENRLAECAGLERRLADTQARLQASLSHPREKAPPVDASLAHRLAAAEARARSLEEELAEARAECEHAERALETLLESAHACQLPRSCPSLCGRAVLYVGGRPGMVERYRALVERFQGRFLHHDGGMEDSLKRLPPLLAGADAVVCGAGNVSHSAYYVAKRFCKQAAKPCVLLKKGSLSSLAGALKTLAAQR